MRLRAARLVREDQRVESIEQLFAPQNLFQHAPRRKSYVGNDAESVTARQLADGPSRAHSVTKRQLDAEWAEPIEIALDMEAEAQAALMQSKDFKRAYEAFAAKRTPEFKGD